MSRAQVSYDQLPTPAERWAILNSTCEFYSYKKHSAVNLKDGDGATAQ